ncbi:MAG: CBS domain-containing protein [Desulfitobacteriaceae bacterium]|nr:CBS domain-containing protein [Clostridia bacterium]MDD4345492.1 CBS domain-containing protein [Desulfitobacteriaceae bacterium]MDD4400637.1 CBS domain-containing protein [Desulfitobacteriaceae bacterium]
MDIILAHKQLDFDALASMVAAQKLYQDSVLIVDSKPNPYVQDFLALYKDRLALKKPRDLQLDLITRVILVDTHDLRRTGSLGEGLTKNPKLQIDIYDHHPYAGPIGPGMHIEQVGACTTLLVEKLAGTGLPLSSFEATLFALGLYEDTGSLLFENTTVRDLRAVAFLLERGAHLGIVSEYLRKPLTAEQKGLLQDILNQGQTEYIQGVPVYFSYTEIKEYVGGLALLAHRVGELVGAETWFLLVKMENRLYIIGRSRGNGLPVNRILKIFGGSGHAKAASVTLKKATGAEAMGKLRRQIDRHVQRPFYARDVMSLRVKTVSPDTTISEVQQILLRYGHTGVPVTNGKTLVGIISRRDVEKSIKHGLDHASVKGFMTTNVITVEGDAILDEVQRLMVHHDIGRLPVVEEGELIGIISRSDILRYVHGGAVPNEEALVRERSQAVRREIMELIHGLPDNIQQFIKVIQVVARDTNCSVYLVGGFVRDLLLLAPTQDLDLVVEGNGILFAEALNTYLHNGQLTLHPRFGTARITFPDKTHIDIAGTRWEYYAFPGALPQVEASSLKEDLFRRDFTINSMAICINENCYGELVDYYGGMRDLQQGEIRFLHNLSFIDDPTRIFRAIRFACRYNYQLAKETSKALTTALGTGLIKNISLERFTEELMLVYHEENYLHMGRFLVESGLFREWFGKDLPWYFNENEKPESKRWSQVQRWLTSVSRMEDADVEVILNKLRLSRWLRKNTREYIRLRTALKGSSGTVTETDTILVHTPAWLVTLLARDNDLKEVLHAYQAALEKIQVNTDGKKLLDLGIKSGPQIGKILGRIRQAWLEGEIKSAAEEEELLQKLLETA